MLEKPIPTKQLTFGERIIREALRLSKESGGGHYSQYLIEAKANLTADIPQKGTEYLPSDPSQQNNS